MLTSNAAVHSDGNISMGTIEKERDAPVAILLCILLRDTQVGRPHAVRAPARVHHRRSAELAHCGQDKTSFGEATESSVDCSTLAKTFPPSVWENLYHTVALRTHAFDVLLLYTSADHIALTHSLSRTLSRKKVVVVKSRDCIIVGVHSAKCRRHRSIRDNPSSLSASGCSAFTAERTEIRRSSVLQSSSSRCCTASPSSLGTSESRRCC